MHGGPEALHLMVHSILAGGREAEHDSGVAGAAHSGLREPREAAAPQIEPLLLPGAPLIIAHLQGSCVWQSERLQGRSDAGSAAS